MEGQLRFSVVEGIQDLAEVHALRLLRYEPRFPTSDFWWLDRDRDLKGKVFILRGNDRTLSTLRIISVTACTTEIEELGHLPADLAGDPEVWELGRVTAVPAQQSDLSYSRLLFCWSAQWAAVNLSIRKVVSYCRDQKLAGFLALGAQVVEGPYAIPNRGNKYYTIVADVTEVVERMRTYGFDALLSAATRGEEEIAQHEVTNHLNVADNSVTTRK